MPPISVKVPGKDKGSSAHGSAIPGRDSPKISWTVRTVLGRASGHRPPVCAWSNKDCNRGPIQLLVIVHLVAIRIEQLKI